jgi:hypothetical protein
VPFETRDEYCNNFVVSIPPVIALPPEEGRVNVRISVPVELNPKEQISTTVICTVVSSSGAKRGNVIKRNKMRAKNRIVFLYIIKHLVISIY